MGILDDNNFDYDYDFNEVILSTDDFVNEQFEKYA
jgi:hypothetical protein